MKRKRPRSFARESKAESLKFLRESLADADAGRTLPMLEAVASLGKKKDLGMTPRKQRRSK